MEHCFRTALWMLFLIGYLQANPVPKEQGDYGFGFLEEVTCANWTFISATNLKDCPIKALQHLRDEFDNARQKCVDENQRIGSTLDAVETYFDSTLKNSEECKLITKERQFKDLVKDLIVVVQLLNSNKTN